MRALLIAHPNGWGGTEINSILMLEALGRRGHRVDVWEVPSAGSGHYAGRWTNPIGELAEHDPRAAKGVAATGWWTRALRRHRPDIVVLAKGDAHACFPGLDLAARRTGIPAVVVEHEPVLYPWDLDRVGPLTFLREWALPGYRRLQLQQRLAKGRISVSAITDQAMNAYLRWSKPGAAVIHPGIPFDHLRHDPDAGRAVRHQLGIPEDAMVFGAIGRFHPKKRYPLALKLFAQAKFPRPAWFLLAGGGEEQGELERVVGELGIGDRVRLVGWLDGDVRRAYLSAIDSFVLLSSIEGLGMTLVEAVACGCHCIATACGGPEEILTDPSLGVLIREGDWEAATAAMISQTLDAAGRRDPAQAEARRALVRRGFDAVTQNERYAEYLEGVLARA